MRTNGLAQNGLNPARMYVNLSQSSLETMDNALFVMVFS